MLQQDDYTSYPSFRTSGLQKDPKGIGQAGAISSISESRQDQSLPPERAELLSHVAANFSALSFQAFVSLSAISKAKYSVVHSPLR